MYYVYFLKCYNSKGQYKIYCGYTSDLTKRVQTHRDGRGAKFTRMYHHKIELVYWEEYKIKQEAMRREWFLKHDKSITRKKKIEMIKKFESDFNKR